MTLVSSERHQSHDHAAHVPARAHISPWNHTDPGSQAGKEEPAVERVCFLGRVRPDRLAEYRRRHAGVWPEMLDALRAAGWTNYSLFLTDDGLVVGYLEPATTRRRWRGWRIPT
jgi:hypothetical protein